VGDYSSIRYYYPGDELPDGTTLLSILKDGITYRDDDDIKTLYMFGRE